MMEPGFIQRWEGPYGEGRSGGWERLPERLGEEMTTSLQFLGTNLGFLDLACGRLVRLLESHRACMGHHPPDVVDRLRAMEKQLDLEYLETETPKALAESLEGLARLACAVRELGAQDNPGTPGNGSCHDR